MTLLLHPSTKLQLSAALPTGAGAVIFHGPVGVGKHAAAIEVVRQRNCLLTALPDCSCKSCVELRSGAYPDLIGIQPEEKVSIGVETIRELVQRLSLAPYYDHGFRFVLIDQAEQLTPQAQNALLKLIEEPPSRTNIILIATDIESLLVTVRSRCRQVYFPALPPAMIAEWLKESLNVNSEHAQNIAELSSGAPGTASTLIKDPSQMENLLVVAETTNRFFTSPLFDRLRIAKTLSEQKGNYPQVISQLHRYAKESAAQGSMTDILSVERLQAQLNSNVSPRAAFERLAIGVGI